MFATAISQMYAREVPQYAALLDIVAETNARALRAGLERSGDVSRVSEERHGAIRLGTSAELQTMRRLFGVMGMRAVGYYDLSAAGLPVHATAFRPTEEASLQRNPFRVFASLLRLDRIADGDLSLTVRSALARRDIFSPRLRSLIDRSEAGGLGEGDARDFVSEAMLTFAWHAEAAVDRATYLRLLQTHALIADIASFKGPHINHLTPRTLDIDAARQLMSERGLRAKSSIEGPPRRACPILLRQTSFKALDEAITFRDASGRLVPGVHTARFGEIEERGVALKPRGRALYDRLLNDARTAPATIEGPTDSDYGRRLSAAFEEFPDTYEELRAREFAYFRYRVKGGGVRHDGDTRPRELSALLRAGLVACDPIVYEDFLPISAAGIFRSNLDGREVTIVSRAGGRELFERQLGCALLDEHDLYATIEQNSLADVRRHFDVVA
jgi:uncharacterized glyoxalase superfamily metalloenzyme YdcJ